MKVVQLCALSFLMSLSLYASQSAILRPSGGPLSRIQNSLGSLKGFNDLVNQASVPSQNVLNPTFLNAVGSTDLSQADVKYYRAFLTETFFTKLSLLMGSTIAAADESSTRKIADPSGINNTPSATFPEFLAKNMQLCRYMRSFNAKYNPTSSTSGQFQGQQLTPLDTFAGVIVINNLTKSTIKFGALIQDQEGGGTDYYGKPLPIIDYPNTPPVKPDYTLISGYDDAVFDSQGNGVRSGDVKFIPAPDFVDAWYNHTDEIDNPAKVRSLWYRTTDTVFNNDANVLTLDGLTSSAYICLQIISEDDGVPTIALKMAAPGPIISTKVLNENIGTDNPAVNTDGLKRFFQNSKNIGWAPVILLSGTNSIDIIGLVKLNPYYFPLYYKGNLVQQTDLKSTNSIASYLNADTELPYFSERRLFDSVVNAYNGAQAMGLMPSKDYQGDPAQFYVPPSMYEQSNGSIDVLKGSEDLVYTKWPQSSLVYNNYPNSSMMLQQPDLTKSGSFHKWTSLSTFSAQNSPADAASMNYLSKQNFALAKMAGFLQYGYLSIDSQKKSYESLLKSSMEALLTYYIKPAFLSPVKDSAGLTVLQRLLANPGQQFSASLGGKTDTFYGNPSAYGDYVPAVNVLTTYIQSN